MCKRKIALVGVFIFFCFMTLRPLCQQASAFVDIDHIDLEKGVSYERYLFSGTGMQIERMFDRAKTVRLSASLRSAAQRFVFPVNFVAYGSITCPDCAIVAPFLEALKDENPLIETLYFERDNKAREMLLERTGLNRIPTIFVTDRSGKILSGHYVEHPHVVYELLAESKTEEEKRLHIGDFRAGKYDDQVQSDLVELIDSVF